MSTDYRHFHCLGKSYRGGVYLADDYLLIVTYENMFWEKYLRLRYTDICALSLQQRPNRRYAIAFSLPIIFSLGLLLLSISSSASNLLIWPALIVAGLLLDFCLSQPNCRMTVYTHALCHPLIYPCTLRQARKIISPLRERLQQTQGVLPTGEARPLLTLQPGAIPKLDTPIVSAATAWAGRLPLLFFLSILATLPVILIGSGTLSLFFLIPSCYLGFVLVLTASHHPRTGYILICFLTALQCLHVLVALSGISIGIQYIDFINNTFKLDHLFSLKDFISNWLNFLPLLSIPAAVVGAWLQTTANRRKT